MPLLLATWWHRVGAFAMLTLLVSCSGSRDAAGDQARSSHTRREPAAPPPGAERPAPDKIQFSDDTPTVVAPSLVPRDKSLEDAFAPLDRRSSLSSVSQPPPNLAPSFEHVLRNRKALQQLADRKDWIFNDGVDGQTNLFGNVFSSDDTGWLGEQDEPIKRGIEKFMEKHQQQNDARAEDRQRRSERRDAEEENDSWRARESAFGRSPGAETGDGEVSDPPSGRFGLAGWDTRRDRESKSGSLDAFSLPSFSAQMNPLSLRLPELPLGRPARADRALEKLDLPSSIAPIRPDLQLIELQPDFTRQELNPITGMGLSGLGSDQPKTEPRDALGFGRSEPAVALPRTGLPSVLDDIGVKSLGESSLSPAIVAPAESPLSRSRPAVLEIPRRPY